MLQLTLQEYGEGPNFYNTSTPLILTYSSLQKNLIQMDLYPFLDTLATPGPDKTLLTTVYRKPTDTDQYLHGASHHNLPAKDSVLNTLTYRARTVIIKRGEGYQGDLQKCKLPNWTISRLRIKNDHKYNTKNLNSKQQINNYTKDNNINMVVPYIKGLSESFRSIYSKMGIQVNFKGGNAIKSIQVAPKDEDTMTQRSEVICSYKCDSGV